MGLFSKRKKTPKLHFALVVADKPLDGATFNNDKDCRLFIIRGETEPGSVIPSSVLRGIVDRFKEPEEKLAEAQKTT